MSQDENEHTETKEVSKVILKHFQYRETKNDVKLYFNGKYHLSAVQF
jgi:hypothetical protein